MSLDVAKEEVNECFARIITAEKIKPDLDSIWENIAKNVWNPKYVIPYIT